MSREILFRGKDESGILNHQWQFGALDNTDEKFPKIIRLDRWGNKMIVNVVPETVGQFTGLTDKNGKKIFEGDIIKSCEYDEVYCVKYFADDNYPAFDVVPEMNITCNGLSHLHIVEGIEIIGNIHDNPELLEVE